MANDLQDDVRAAGRKLRDIAKAEPVIAISKGIAKVGAVAEKKAKTLWERIKEDYTTIRELAKVGKPKKVEKPKKVPTPTEVGEIRRKVKRRADAEKRKAEARKRRTPQ